MLKSGCNVIYVSYNGVLEEIAPSQVIPYLRQLAKENYRFTLLTFEKKEKLNEAGPERMEALRKELAAYGIEWHWLRYHKRLPLLATSLDIFLGSIAAIFFIFLKKARIAHVRSIVPAVMCLPAKLTGVRIVFDTRGLLAEEYVGGGHWREGGLKYNLVKFFERACLSAADAVVVLTEYHRRYILESPAFKKTGRQKEITVIPCCADLQRFSYIKEAGPLRKREGLEGAFIFSYVGKIGKHYMLEEMFDFLKVSFEMMPNSLFMILTQSDKADILRMAADKKIEPQRVIIKRPRFDEIPYLISLAHAGIFFINPYKKFGSSPIKLGEFLGCGVPVIINEGIGDTGEFVNSNRVGVVLNELETESYKKVFLSFLELLKEGPALSARCRKAAEEYLSLGIGVKKYSDIYRGICQCTA